MKVATYTVGGERRVGVVDEARQTVSPFDLSEAEASGGILALIDRGHLPDILNPMPLKEATLEAPIPRPLRNIFCVGKNYHEHAKEFSASGFDSSAAQGTVPQHPIIFSKVPECVVGPRAPVLYSRDVSTAIDYEAELTIIIGKGGRNISKADALDHVWGYTILNDVTARDLQKQDGQWTRGKGFDTFAPIGPWIDTEFDPANRDLLVTVNGEVRQRSNTDLMIYPIPRILSFVTRFLTLEPGDVILTGTPEGVGPVQPGDVMTVEIDGLGGISNPVITEEEARRRGDADYSA